MSSDSDESDQNQPGLSDNYDPPVVPEAEGPEEVNMNQEDLPVAGPEALNLNPVNFDLGLIPQQNGHFDPGQPDLELDDGFGESDEEGDPNENVQNDYVYHEGDQDGSQAGSDSTVGDHDSEDEESPPAFDPELPMRHSYLGQGMEELQGRVVLEDDSVLEIPIAVLNLHLVPGQIIPMTVFHAVFQNAIRRCVLNDRMFGIVNTGLTEGMGGRSPVVSRGAFGTLAEIYEFQEETDGHNPMDLNFGSSFAIKARGRHRFNVLEVRRQADGNLMAKVRIRPEVRLPSLISEVMSHGTARYKFPIPALVGKEREEEPPAEPSVAPDENGPEASLKRLTAENKARRPSTRYYSVFTPWPAFVQDNYDERILVERVHLKLQQLRGLTSSPSNIPFDPSELSFWLAQNLTMDDTIRLQILKLDSPIQRLRFELTLLENVTRVISCRRCFLGVADQADIFAMSVEGPQGTYVNPNGYVHETLTVYKAKELLTRGPASTEACWFPGYSWTIVECRGCRQHLGWKFLASGGRLKPKKFWGLSRRSVTFKYNFSRCELSEEAVRRGSSPMTSTSSHPDVSQNALMLPPLPPPPPHHI